MEIVVHNRIVWNCIYFKRIKIHFLLIFKLESWERNVEKKVTVLLSSIPMNSMIILLLVVVNLHLSRAKLFVLNDKDSRRSFSFLSDFNEAYS